MNSKGRNPIMAVWKQKRRRKLNFEVELELQVQLEVELELQVLVEVNTPGPSSLWQRRPELKGTVRCDAAPKTF
jgi:hypothetical protein